MLCADPATVWIHKQLLSSRFVLVYYKCERILHGAFPVVLELPQAEDTDVKGPMFYFIFLKDFIYSFLEGKGGRKRGKETSMCGCLLCTPYWGPGPQPTHVP